jgi:hypothetical protein
MTKKRPNKYGANQHVPDPRQSKFLKHYLDPKSETFSNALRSALKAGYGKEYSESLTAQMPTWLSDSLGDLRKVQKAEQNLDEFLDIDIKNQGVTKDGKGVYEYDDVGKLRVKADITKFVAERLKKDKYSIRQEHTGAEGEPLQITTVMYGKKKKK